MSEKKGNILIVDARHCKSESWDQGWCLGACKCLVLLPSAISETIYKMELAVLSSLQDSGVILVLLKKNVLNLLIKHIRTNHSFCSIGHSGNEKRKHNDWTPVV
jgi:hypothetical protein